MLRADRRSPRLLVRHPAVGGGGQRGHDGRGVGRRRRTTPGRQGHRRAPGCAVRILHVRNRGQRRGPSRVEPRPVRIRGPQCARRQSLPLRRPQPGGARRARRRRRDARTRVTAESLSPTLAANPRLGDWLRIDSGGVVEIRSGKVELGQGVLTALAQVAAEELDVDVARIAMTATATDRSPDEGLTAGSLAIQPSGAALRQVCAEARDIYLGVAADKFAVPKDDLTVDDGHISAPDGTSTSYWELADDGLLDRDATGDVATKPVSGYRVVGASVARLDLPDKLAGRPRYVHDVTLDAMVYGK